MRVGERMSPWMGVRMELLHVLRGVRMMVKLLMSRHVYLLRVGVARMMRHVMRHMRMHVGMHVMVEELRV